MTEQARIAKVSGSEAREARSWYYKSRKLLPEPVVQHRMDLCSEIIALLVTNINRRKQALRRSR